VTTIIGPVAVPVTVATDPVGCCAVAGFVSGMVTKKAINQNDTTAVNINFVLEEDIYNLNVFLTYIISREKRL